MDAGSDLLMSVVPEIFRNQRLFARPTEVECSESPVVSGKGTVEIVVYRPAKGAGQRKSRRLWLGGKQKPAGCDKINTGQADTASI